jgi:hypothetical protein
MPQAKDDADIASEQEEYARTEALWRVKEKAKRVVTGRCHNCDEPLLLGQPYFCDVNCSADFEKREQAINKCRPKGTLTLAKVREWRETKDQARDNGQHAAYMQRQEERHGFEDYREDDDD